MEVPQINCSLEGGCAHDPACTVACRKITDTWVAAALAEHPELPGLEATLSERGARYGPFKEHARVTNGLLSVMESGTNWQSMPDEHRHALRVIADKIGRMLTGDAMYADNWHDIQGYAKLAEKACKTST